MRFCTAGHCGSVVDSELPQLRVVPARPPSELTTDPAFTTARKVWPSVRKARKLLALCMTLVVSKFVVSAFTCSSEKAWPISCENRWSSTFQPIATTLPPHQTPLPVPAPDPKSTVLTQYTLTAAASKPMSVFIAPALPQSNAV